MESRAFIRQAQLLIVKIQDLGVLHSPEELKATRESCQREVNQLFAGLSNPTLSSAGRLCDAALYAGLQVKPEVQQRLSQAEYCWH